MHLDNDIKLDFKDVLIRPKRSTLTSRSQVDITREIKFRWSSEIFQNIPIIAANMDTTGTFEMARALGRHKMMTALHKHYEADQYIDFFKSLEVKSDAFYSLGIGEPTPLSALHGHGTGDLLDACLEHFPPEDAADADADYTRVAVIGKPNVGKSSLVNLILGEKRVIVSNVAGTTRDSVDTRFENKYGKYIFVDTAGIRRKSRVDDRIEKFSVMRAKLAIERADVCLIMIDARDGVTEQDTKIAGLAHEAGKASIIVVNKWDLVEKETGTMEKMRKDVLRDLSFMSYAPVLFISALTGQRTERLFELINFVNDQSAMRITTGMLNNVLADAQARVQPPTDKGRRLKIYYMTQVGVCPPHFVVFCNERKLFHFSYQRYLENCIRNVFGLEGTPVIMSIREKGDKED